MGKFLRLLGLSVVGLSVFATAQYDTGTSIGFGQTNFCQTAQSNAPFADLIVGPHHALLQRTDGSIVAWGSTPHGVCDLTALQGQTTLYSVYFRGLGGIAAGNGFTISVAPYQANYPNLVGVAAWGLNTYGQCNIPSTLQNGLKAAAGVNFAVCLQQSPGAVVGWGSNSVGQLGFGTVTDAVGVAAGAFYTVILHSDGTVTCFGDNSAGQCNVPAGLTGVTQVAAGHNHTLALLSNGTVVGWGNNSYGECTLPNNGIPFIQVAASDYYSVGLRADGTVVCSGWNDFNQCVVPVGLNNVIRIGAGYKHALVLKNDGTVVGWGLNTNGDASPPPVALSNATKVLPGLALMADGSVKTWGMGTASFASQLAALPAVQDISGMSNEAAVVESSGALWTAPFFSGSAGTSVTQADINPVQAIALHSDSTVTTIGQDVDGAGDVPTGLTGVKQVANGMTSSGHAYSLALMLDGTVQGWGYNGDGELNFPAGLANVVQISSRNGTVIALKSDGTVVAWGNNFYQQTNVPIGLSNVVQITCGDANVLALKGDGSLAQWGNSAGFAVGLPVFANSGFSSIADRGGNMIANLGLSLTNDEQTGTGMHQTVNYTLSIPKPSTSDTIVAIHVYGPNSYGDKQFNETIPAGSTSATFQAIPNENVTWVSATLNGATIYSSTDNRLFLTPSALSTYASSVVGGNTTTASISYNGVPGNYLRLESSPNIEVPPLVLCGAAGTIHIPVYTNPVSSTYAGWIRVLGGNSGTGVVKTTNLTLLPVTITAPALYPAHLVGGASSQVVINLSRPAPPTGLEVGLTTDQPTVLSFPDRVVFPAGAQTATIYVHTRAPISAVAAHLYATYSGQALSSTLTVYPQWEKSLAFYKTVLSGGTSTTGILTLTQGAPTAGLTVQIASSDPSLTVPPSVTIPVGATTVTFPITTSAVTNTTPVTITASETSGSVSGIVTVTP